jgi:energy-converting hydrogenase B subunit D
VIVATLVPLQVAIFSLVGLGATALVLTRDPLKMAIVSGFYGWLLTMLFFVLAAPDVALSMLVVSSVGYPLIVLVAVTRWKKR